MEWMNAEISRISRCMLLTAVCAVLVCLTANAAEQEQTVVGNAPGRYSVEFKTEIPARDACCGQCNYVLEITDQFTNSTSDVTLARPMYPVAESSLQYHWADEAKLVVEATWNGRPDSATFLFIINAAVAEVTDTIRCRDPKPSSSKRYWVYEKYVQSRAPLWVSTSVILCYDVHKSPRENRMDPDARFPSDDEVGWAVYPPPFVAEQAYFLPDQQQNHRAGWYNLLSPFLWAEDADKVYFLCQEYGKPTDLVEVDMGEGPEYAHVEALALPSETEKVRPFTVRPSYADEVTTEWVPHIVAGELSWHDKTHITIHTHSVYNPRAPDEFLVRVP
ncbi:MAG: hypothetical protein KJ060_12035 [Candidatus Hydrogenedentes bacterium]|nr:hypothetical protein [Candidatus Hydrogenedentota bacterium]